MYNIYFLIINVVFGYWLSYITFFDLIDKTSRWPQLDFLLFIFSMYLLISSGMNIGNFFILRNFEKQFNIKNNSFPPNKPDNKDDDINIPPTATS